jgi:hypothetical protein
MGHKVSLKYSLMACSQWGPTTKPHYQPDNSAATGKRRENQGFVQGVNIKFDYIILCRDEISSRLYNSPRHEHVSLLPKQINNYASVCVRPVRFRLKYQSPSMYFYYDQN